MIERLRRDPMAAGTRLLSASGVMLDGQRAKLYSVDPRHVADLPVPRHFQGSRIIFAYRDETLHVLGAYSNHAEYDAACNRLSL